MDRLANTIPRGVEPRTIRLRELLPLAYTRIKEQKSVAGPEA